MSVKELISKEIERVPERFLGEILDFIRFMETKATEEKMVAAVASESSLRKDWLTPEEDKAWQHL
ncbi:DUF2281 domain-containing protein [bacterium]|nr:DUF2281 domain-containing protein [bacterium]